MIQDLNEIKVSIQVSDQLPTKTETSDQVPTETSDQLPTETSEKLEALRSDEIEVQTPDNHIPSFVKRFKEKTIKKMRELTTLHGLNHILSSKSKVKTFEWLFIVVVAFLYSFYYVTSDILNYFEYPVVSVIDTAYEDRPCFPKITFCNHNLVNSTGSICYFNNDFCPANAFKYDMKLRNAECNEFNSGHANGFDIEILRSGQTGRFFGLDMLLPVIDKGPLIIQINNQSTNSFSTRNISISPGLTTQIAITRTFHYRLGPPYSNCKSEYTFESKPFDQTNQTKFQYFQSDCFSLCEVKKRADILNISSNFTENMQYFFTNQTHYNLLTDFIYGNETNVKLCADFFAKFLKKGINHECAKMCPLECNSVTYSITINNIKSPYQNFAGFHIYYDSFFYTRIIEVPQMTIENLLGNVGGILGLCLGASLMSIVEIFNVSYSLVRFYVINIFKKF